MIPAPAPGSRRVGLAVLTIAQLVGFGAAYGGVDGFLSAGNLTTIAQNSATLLVAAAGSALLLITGNVDLSIGSQYALVSVVSAWVAVHLTASWVGLVAGVVLGGLLGAVNGLLVRWLETSPLIVTIGMLALYRGLAYLVGDGVPVDGVPHSMAVVGQCRLLGVPLPVIVCVLAFAAVGWTLAVTRSGLRLYAIGGDPSAARRAGVPVGRTVVGAYVANGALVAVAAVLDTARLTSGAPGIAVGFEVSVLTAVVLGGVMFTGGVGRLGAVLVAVVALGVLDAGLIFAGLADWYQQIARGVLLLAAVAADQLLTRRAARPTRPETATETATETAPARGPVPGDLPAPAGRGGTVPVRPGVRLRLEAVAARYGGSPDGVSLTVEPGEVLCLVGDNGAGKSTLARLAAGDLAPVRGAVLLNGVPLPACPAAARAAGVATVFQDLALCPNLGAADNVHLGAEPVRRLFGVLGVRDHRAAAAAAAAALARTGVPVPDLHRPVSQLSGGQRQAVALARALVARAPVVVLDEPTSALSAGNAARVLELVRRLGRDGHTVLLVTHDLDEVFGVGGRVAVVARGSLVHEGRTAELDRLALLGLLGSGRRDH